MPETKRSRAKLITPVGRLTFPAIFAKGRPIDPMKEPKYEATIVFDVDAIKKNPQELQRYNAIKAEADRVCKEKFGKDVKACADSLGQGFWNPFRNGTEKEHLDGYGAGKIFFKTSSKRKPGVVTAALAPVDDPEAVYSGCYVRLNVTPFAFANNGKKGVSIMLNSVMFQKDGERLDGGSNAEEDFGEVAEMGDAGSATSDDLL